MSDTKPSDTKSPDAEDSGAKHDYRATLFLPATDFPMKAGLPEAEPRWLARWAEMDLYGKLRESAKGRPLFVLHDGPIYANGDIHSGTGLNHILKDFVVRSQPDAGQGRALCAGLGLSRPSHRMEGGREIPRGRARQGRSPRRTSCAANAATSPPTG